MTQLLLTTATLIHATFVLAMLTLAILAAAAALMIGILVLLYHLCRLRRR